MQQTAAPKLATMVTVGDDVHEHLVHIAHELSTAPANANRAAAEAVAAPDALLAQWDTGLAAWEPLACEVVGFPHLQRERALVRRYITGRTQLLNERIDRGHILESGDVLGVVANLAMDLDVMGRPDLAQVFVGAYQRLSGDRFPASLLHLYVAHNAMRRATHECQRVVDGDATAIKEARAYANSCFRHLEFARPFLLMVGGAHTDDRRALAAHLAEATGWVRVREDDVRRNVGAADTTVRSDGGTAAGDAAYATLDERAAILLRGGFSVIVDAAFATRAARNDARSIADAACAEVVELECAARDDNGAAAPREPWPSAHPIDMTMSNEAQVVRCLRHVGETPVAALAGGVA